MTHFIGQRVILDLSASPPNASIRKVNGFRGVITSVDTMGFDWGVRLDNPVENYEIFPASNDEMIPEEGPW